MNQIWNIAARWLFGRGSGARIRLVEEVHLPPGMFVCVPLAGSVRQIRADLVLSDRFGPAVVREVVEFAARRGLPVDGWVVRGIGHLPYRCETAARWLAGLAEAAGSGTILVAVGELEPDLVERLGAHLRNVHGAVETDDSGRDEARAI